MHAVAARPLYLAPQDVHETDLDREKALLRDQVGSGLVIPPVCTHVPVVMDVGSSHLPHDSGMVDDSRLGEGMPTDAVAGPFGPILASLDVCCPLVIASGAAVGQAGGRH